MLGKYAFRFSVLEELLVEKKKRKKPQGRDENNLST
jgi:hypothetical protein